MSNDVRDYAEHVLTCDVKQCGHRAHLWAQTTEQGRAAVAEAMRTERAERSAKGPLARVAFWTIFALATIGWSWLASWLITR